MNILNFLGVPSYTWQIEINLGDRKQTEVICGGEVFSSMGTSFSFFSPDRTEMFTNQEPISGAITISHYSATKLDHQGIEIYLIGETEQCSLESTEQWEFQSECISVAPAGSLTGSSHNFTFSFDQEMIHESYYGLFVTMRYFLRVVIKRKFAANIQHSREIFSVRYTKPNLDGNRLIKLEGGVKDCLHVHYNFPRNIYHLNDIITGTIFFELIRINVTKMELSLIRKERTGRIPSVTTVISTYEILDGAPVKGETVPIRMFLGGLPLTPTFRDVEGIDVLYYIQTSITDEQNLKYEHKSRITLWRDLDPAVQPKFIDADFNPYPTDKLPATSPNSDETDDSSDTYSSDSVIPTSM